jgi:hypothetical protein
MTSLKWKSSEILKVNGSTIKEGVFVGHDGNNEKRPVNFTPELINKIYDSIDCNVPIYLGHDDTPTRKPIGYAFKFGMSPSHDDIQYEGFIFNEAARNKIVTEGWDKVSPELDIDYDISGGYTNASVSGISFVPRPAIAGTEANMGVAVFSKPEDENKDREVKNMTGKAMFDDQAAANAVQTSATGTTTSNTTGTYTVPPAVFTPVVTPTAPDSGLTADDVASLRQELAEAKAAREAERVKNDKLMNQRVDEMVTELKSLGVENPSDIVKGLSSEQKQAVLSKLKSTMVKNQEMAQPSTNPGSVPESSKNVSQEQLFKETLKELGMTVEEYNKLTGGI